MTSSIALSASLRLALRSDAAVSTAAGLLQTAAGGALTSMLGLPSPLLWWSGLFMLVHAASLVWLARGRTRPPALVAVVVVGNMGWAAACLFVWALGIVSPTVLGVDYLAVQALAVFALAAWQFIGWRASSSALRGGASPLSAK
jgi:hypothetical protein